MEFFLSFTDRKNQKNKELYYNDKNNERPFYPIFIAVFNSLDEGNYQSAHSYRSVNKNSVP